MKDFGVLRLRFVVNLKSKQIFNNHLNNAFTPLLLFPFKLSIASTASIAANTPNLSVLYYYL